MTEDALEFDGFEWDEGNRAKCLKHGVPLAEIEQALRVVRYVADDPFPGEKRYRTVGRTSAGRHAFCRAHAARVEAAADQRPLHARARGGEL